MGAEGTPPLEAQIADGPRRLLASGSRAARSPWIGFAPCMSTTPRVIPTWSGKTSFSSRSQRNARGGKSRSSPPVEAVGPVNPAMAMRDMVA